MDRAPRERRTPRRMFAILLTLGRVAAILTVLAPGANAGKKACGARNRRAQCPITRPRLIEG